jgi:hypothetical protein
MKASGCSAWAARTGDDSPNLRRIDRTTACQAPAGSGQPALPDAPEAPSQDSLPGNIVDTHPPKVPFCCLPSSPQPRSEPLRPYATPQLPSRSQSADFSPQHIDCRCGYPTSKPIASALSLRSPSPKNGALRTSVLAPPASARCARFSVSGGRTARSQGKA